RVLWHPLTWPAALGCGLGVAYATTLLTDVGYETDTAKFDYLGWVLGTAHPPGYPLYTVLNAVFVRLVPLGTLALRANLLSAVFAVAACLLLYAALVALGVRRPLAAAGAGLLGVTRTLWSQAVVAEVYTLHLLLVAAILLLLLRWRHSGRDRDLLLALGVYALSFSHHLSTALLAPGVAWFVLRADPRVLARPRVLGALPLVTVAGLVPYAYLFWRAADPSLVYEEVRMTGLASFWAAFSGGGFRQQMFAFGLRSMLTDRLGMFAGLVGGQPLLPAVPFAAVGAARLGAGPAGGLLAAWALTNTVWAMGYDVGDVHVFFLPTYLVLVVWATLGAEAAVRALPDRVAAPATALLLAAPLAAAWTNHGVVDLSGDRTAAEVRAALDDMVGGGVVFTYHFHHFTYFLTGLGLGEAYRIHPQYPLPHERIDAYCDGVALDAPHVGGTAPPGLPAYAYGRAYAAQLSAGGFALTPVGGELFRVECARSAR
ncbi:MAG: DUF2723 domain-containing protein, partial [Actinomycetota bacterium]|nr:DUF2723 domain-containing protein [Actinomycetota bacterium]